MKHATRGGLTILATAVLVACAAQREAANSPAAPETIQSGNLKADTASLPMPLQKEAETLAIELPPLGNERSTAQLAAVVVTEQKRQSVPAEVAIPVTAISREELSRAGAKKSRDRAEREQQSTATMISTPPPPLAKAMTYAQPVDTEQYQHQQDNPVHLAAENPVSTFSIDVDTGAYANVRRFLNAGQLPPQDAVRVEEMINYFDYQYAPPANRAAPFRVTTELAYAPWNPNSMLLKIGIKGYEISASERPASNLVFLIDVSGSMNSPDKLPLLKNAFRLLTEQLTARDRVSMVVYAGNSGVVLEPTPGNEKHKILAALEQLQAGGSTNGAQGIKLAYQLARDAHIDKGINRVILATDGDFNVGVVNFEALIDMAERERQAGTAITTLGFGTGNYNDKLMERLADAGNGNYAYVDSLNEARKVLVSELSSTLFTIAKDVKIQVEFNPAEVLEYRLIGYENRALSREDFNNDKVDAGDIGAGHRVTALYEIVPVGGKSRVDALRYSATRIVEGKSGELANVKLRYKQPDSETSTLLAYPLMKNSLVAADKVSTDFKLAASVAAFGQLLRGGKYVGNYSYDDVAKLAKGALGEDTDGYRREFVSLVKLADALAPKNVQRVGKAQ
jgi:Ca-activated chloride channel family protein